MKKGTKHSSNYDFQIVRTTFCQQIEFLYLSLFSAIDSSVHCLSKCAEKSIEENKKLVICEEEILCEPTFNLSTGGGNTDQSAVSLPEEQQTAMF